MITALVTGILVLIFCAALVSLVLVSHLTVETIKRDLAKRRADIAAQGKRDRHQTIEALFDKVREFAAEQKARR